MAWVKLESNFPFNHKVAEAGPAAAFLDICGWCYCRTHNTDGYIPDAHIGMLGPIPDPRKLAAKLVAVGRWVRDDELRGWWVHDFLEYNPSDESERAAAAARSSKASDAAKARWRSKKGLSKSDADAQEDARSIARRMPDGCLDDAESMPPSPPLPKASDVVDPVGTSQVLAHPGFAPDARRNGNGEPRGLGTSLATLGRTR